MQFFCSQLVLLHLSLLWQTFMTCYVNKASPINFADGICHIKQLKAGKSCKTCLTNHKRSISHHIMPLVINGLGGRHIHGHTDMRTKAISRNQVCTSLWLAHTWCLTTYWHQNEIVLSSIYHKMQLNQCPALLVNYMVIPCQANSSSRIYKSHKCS